MGGGGRYASSGIHLVLDTRDNSAMDESLSYLNGQFVPVSQMTLPATDAGFALGATVTEQLRTFSGRVFHLEQHLERLYRSLQIVGIQPQEAPADLTSAAEKLVTANWQLGDPKDDLGLCIFATPGPLPTFHLGQSGSPCVGLHTYPLPFSLWAEKYQSGQRLIVTDIEQVPSSCWPPELKCRSRIHYHLADRAAAAVESGSRGTAVGLGRIRPGDIDCQYSALSSRQRNCHTTNRGCVTWNQPCGRPSTGQSPGYPLEPLPLAL